MADVPGQPAAARHLTGSGTAGTLAGGPWAAGQAAWPPRLGAVTLLSWYVLLLMAIPSYLVIGPLGAAGPPATVLAAGLACWYLTSWCHPALRPDADRQPMRLAAVIFSCSVLASYASANLSSLPSLQVNGADRGLILLAAWLGVLLVAADGIEDHAQLAVLMRRVVIGATAVAALGIAEFITRSDLTSSLSIPGLQVNEVITDLMTRNGLVRVNSTASQPLEFSAVLTMCLPLAIHQARYAARSRRLRRWLQVAVIGGTVPMAVSRSELLGLAAMALILLPSWPRRDRRRGYLAMALFPLAVYLVRPGLIGSLARSFSQLGSDSSSTSRSGALSMAMPLISQHPWLGMGFQTFFPQSYFFVDDQFVTSLIETGVVGLAAVLALFTAGLLTARAARRSARDRETRDLAWSLTAAIAVAAISFATFDMLSFPMASGLFFLILGCTGAAWRLARVRAARDGGSGRPAAQGRFSPT